MSIEFTINEIDETILIKVSDSISLKDIKWMQNRTVELLKMTGTKNYIVDLTHVTSIVEQNTHTTYKVGKGFTRIKFPLSTKTAVILPQELQSAIR